MGFSKIKIIFLVLLLVSCGSKKKTVQRERESSVSIEHKALKTRIDNDIHSNATLIHEGSKTTIKPIDANKPSTYNGIKFQNAVIEQTQENKVETKTEVDKTVEISTDRSNTKSEVDRSETNKDIDVDRSWGLFDWLWLFLAVAIVVVVIIMYMKKINPLKGLKNIIGIK